MVARFEPDRYVRDLRRVGRGQAATVGGKAAALGELLSMGGVHVPQGFCVTTDAYWHAVAEIPAIEEPLDRLAHVAPGDLAPIRSLSAAIRHAIERHPVPTTVAAAVTQALAGDGTAYAVRSSATGEDGASRSFAGQYDTYLDVRGGPAVVDHVRRCWASLFTERAVTYRARQGIGHRQVAMAVVVQEMVSPRASGTMFTADPVTSDRTVVAIEAVPGLGDGLVAGRADPDVFRLHEGRVHSTLADPAREPVLTADEVRRLGRLGRRIEAHAGAPQDIEWCLAEDGCWIVQSRPITTLFPIPVADDGRFHVYVSVGHQQMMTDPMTPLGRSVWQLTAARPMVEAGSRLFVDVTALLSSPASRGPLMDNLGRSDPLIGDALQSILDRGAVPLVEDGEPRPVLLPSGAPPTLDADPGVVGELVARTEASLDEARRRIDGRRGDALFEAILADIDEMKRVLFDPQSLQVIMAAMSAAWWLDEQLQAWLGEPHAADVLSQSVPGNVTSEMGLALLDVADAMRPHPEVVAYLRDTEDEGILDGLAHLDGGQDAEEAFRSYLDAYGMRGAGEIDIARPRWVERPRMLVPLLLANVRDAAPGEAARRFERGRAAAVAAEQEILRRVRCLPGGERKAAEVEAMIARLRTFIGYREHPKYGIVRRYLIYKEALLAEAARLVHDGVLDDPEDVYFLGFAELRDVVRSRRVDRDLVRRRRDEFRAHHALTPPRVLTSAGEALGGSYRRADLPPGALAGLAVSAGTVEGRARVVIDMAGAALEAGDILVTAHTDPSWSPLFVAAAGLVTEVGGLMTHGAVIAREYGLPAVVGVVDATQRIVDGQRIRVDGTAGSVEILAGGDAAG